MLSHHRRNEASRRTLQPQRRLPKLAIFVCATTLGGAALASLGEPPHAVDEPPIVRAADEGAKAFLDERLHLHLKRAAVDASR